MSNRSSYYLYASNDILEIGQRIGVHIDALTEVDLECRNIVMVDWSFAGGQPPAGVHPYDYDETDTPARWIAHQSILAVKPECRDGGMVLRR